MVVLGHLKPNLKKVIMECRVLPTPRSKPKIREVQLRLEIIDVHHMVFRIHASWIRPAEHRIDNVRLGNQIALVSH